MADPDVRTRVVGTRLEEIFEREVIDPILDFADPAQEWRRLF